MGKRAQDRDVSAIKSRPLRKHEQWAVIQDLLAGEYNNPIRVIALLPNAGPRTFPRMSPANCSVAAIFR